MVLNPLRSGARQICALHHNPAVKNHHKHNDDINCIAEDDRHRLWVKHDGGNFADGAKRKQSMAVPAPASGQRAKQIVYDFVRDRSGNVDGYESGHWCVSAHS
jgi:hypothetical protein